MKTLLSILISGCLLLSSAQVSANEVEEQMKIISSQYRIVLNTESPEEFTQALQVMQKAVLQSEQAVPSKLAKQATDSSNMQDYRHGLSLLTDEIDIALAQVQAGKFQDAKQTVEQFKQLRNEYHQKYK